MTTVRVNLAERSYDIMIQGGAMAQLGEWVSGLGFKTKVLVVADENTSRLFGAAAEESLRSAGLEPVLAVVPPGEASKSLGVADVLYAQAIANRLDRSSPVLALGGGVVGDLAGFVAATFLRGVPFLQVPTTLLSQVDSSVGGKVAVNHALGKNLIGAFYQPKGVLIDPLVLHSLPEREFASGMAEVIKYGMIADAEFLELLNADRAGVVRRDAASMEHIVARCCRMKAAVVERDEQDVGERMLLNFGHTAGHAIEAAGNFERFTHGEGVALGMLVAARMGELQGMLPSSAVNQLRFLLRLYGLPSHATGLQVNELIQLMGTDKKREGARLRWILLDRPGQARVESNISLQTLREALQGILQVE